MASQTKDVKSGPPGVGEEFDIGPVTGTRGGNPDPLPGPVTASNDRPDLGEIIAGIVPDAFIFRTRDELVDGTAVVTIESGPLSDTVIVTVTSGAGPTADALVIPLSGVRVKS